MSAMVKAIAFANAAHAGQFRGDKVTPYIFHPIAVAGRVMAKWPDAECAAIAAVLHDVVEDTDVGIAQIIEEFGVVVASVVSEVTDAPGVSGDDRFAAQMKAIPQLSDAALRVKYCDKVSNLIDLTASPPAWDIEKIDRHANRMQAYLLEASRELRTRGMM